MSEPQAATAVPMHRTLSWRHVPLLSCITALIVGAVVRLAAPVKYTATTTLLLNERPDIVSSLSGANSDMPVTFSAVAGIGSLRSSVQERLQTILESRSIRAELVKKYDLAGRLGMSEAEAIQALGDMTRIKVIGGTGLSVRVTCTAPSVMQSWLRLPVALSTEQARQLCADLANAYLAALDRHVIETRVAEARASRRFIEKRKREVAGQLAKIEEQLEKLQVRYNLVDPKSKASELAEQLRMAETAYRDAVAQVDSLAGSLEAARRKLQKEDAMLIAEEVTTRNPVIAQLEGKLAELRMKQATELASGKTAAHPQVVQLKAAIADIEQQLQGLHREVRQQVAQRSNPTYSQLCAKVAELQINLAGALARKKQYAAQLAAINARAAKLPSVARQYVSLSREQLLQSNLLSTLAQRLELAVIEEQHQESSGRFTVLDVAVPPTHRSGPSALQWAAAAFFATAISLALVLGYAHGLFKFE